MQVSIRATLCRRDHKKSRLVTIHSLYGHCWLTIPSCFRVQPAVLLNTIRAKPDSLADNRLTKEYHEPWSVISPQTSTNPEHTCASVSPIAMELLFKCQNKWCLLYWWLDRLCGLVVRVSGYRYRGLGFDSRRCQIFWVVVGLERGPLSLVRSI